MNIYKEVYSLSPIYQGGLTNHAPMLLQALLELQMDEALIKEKLRDYKNARMIGDLEDSTYPKSEFDIAYINQTNFYSNEIKNQGKETILKIFLEEHVPQLSSGLFHGLIRLYYAMQSKDDILLAQAMSYFHLISDNRTYPHKHVRVASLQQSLLNLLEARNKLDIVYPSKGTYHKVSTIINQDELTTHFVKPIDNDKLRKTVLRLLATMYLSTNDFYILHCLTGYQALLGLLPYITNEDEVIQDFYLAVQPFLVLEKHQYIPEFGISSETIEESLTYLDKVEDPHDVKLLYSVLKLSKTFQEPLLSKIAVTIVQKYT